MPKLTVTSPYVHSRVDSTPTHLPWATLHARVDPLTQCQSWLYPPGQALRIWPLTAWYFSDARQRKKNPKMGNKYSQKRNCATTVPISTFMFLWAFYISPRSISLFCCREYVDRSWSYTNRSQTHECIWDWAAQFPEKEYINGIFVAVRENCQLLLGK